MTQEFTDSTNDSELLQVITKYKGSSLGTCYSIRPKDPIVGLGIFKIDFVARLGIYVYLGYPGQFMYLAKTKVKYILRVFA